MGMIRGAKKFGNANLRQKAAKMRRCRFSPDRHCKSVPAPAVASVGFALQTAGLAARQ